MKTACMGRYISLFLLHSVVCRYGETNIKFVSYRLNDIREKRGLRKSDKQPIVEHFPEPVTSQEETGSVATDISVHLPVFMEKLDGK